MFQEKGVEEINTHILCSIFFSPRKSCLLWNSLGKYSRPR